jgi:protease I
MSTVLDGQRIAFSVAHEGVEQVELTEPWNAVLKAGGSPELIAPESGSVRAFNHVDRGERFDVDRSLDSARGLRRRRAARRGGQPPDALRTDERAVRLLRDAFSAGTPVGAICHGPWTLVEADLVRERTITSWRWRPDIRNAGGDWVDREVVDHGLVSSRNPDDLPRVLRQDRRGVRRGPPPRRSRDELTGDRGGREDEPTVSRSACHLARTG